MMKVKWNNCFLCLKELNTKTKTNLQASKLLFKYLLDTKNQTYGHVLQEISDELGGGKVIQEGVGVPLLEPLSTSSVTGSAEIQFCENCEQLTQRIVKSHLEFEVAQITLINGLKVIKEIVITNSKIYGKNEASKIGLDLFENWLRKERDKGIIHANERKILDLLYAFQTAVFERDKDSLEIPAIYLNKCCYIKPSKPAIFKKDVNSFIKVEPLENDPSAFGSSLNDESCFSPMGFSDNLDEPVKSESSFSLRAVRKRKKKDPVNSRKKTGNKTSISKTRTGKGVTSKQKTLFKETELLKTEQIKTELLNHEKIPDSSHESEQCLISIVKVDENDSKVRKTRSAASVASQRITEIKLAPKAQYNFIEKKSQIKQRRKVGLPKPKPNQIFLSPKVSTNNCNSSKDGSKKKLKSGRGRTYRELPSFATRSMHKGKQKNRHRPLYVCETENCQFTTLNPYTFEHHLRDHETGQKSFTCDKCPDNRSFSGKQHYEFHMASHDGFNKIQCDCCLKHILAVDLIDHIKTHTDKVFPCLNCSHCSSTREKYLNHLTAHGTRGKLRCDLCDLIFRSRHKLLSHLYEIHKAIEKFVCNIDGCTKGFLTLENLKLHQKVHTQPFVCPECDKRFVDCHKLKIHQLAHTGERPFKCEHCSECFINNANLQRHVTREHDGEKYKCDQCSNVYSCKQSLLVHMAVHDGTGFPCGHPGCDKAFGNKTLWRRHQISHSNERNHMCEECGLQLKSRQQWKKHMLIHIGDKKFKCKYCDKAFILEKYLVNHVRIHTGEKPFVCDICGNAFNQYAALYMHKRKHLGSAAPPVNNATGRPRLKDPNRKKVITERVPHFSSVSLTNPPKDVPMLPLKNSSADNESVSSQCSSSGDGEAMSLTKDRKPEELSIGRGRDRADTDFPTVTGSNQHHLQTLAQAQSHSYPGISNLPIYKTILQHSSNSNSSL